MSESERTLPEERIRIPEIDVRASAGAGVIHEGFEETAKIWCFPDPIIRYECRVRPAFVSGGLV